MLTSPSKSGEITEFREVIEVAETSNLCNIKPNIYLLTKDNTNHSFLLLHYETLSNKTFTLPRANHVILKSIHCIKSSLQPKIKILSLFTYPMSFQTHKSFVRLRNLRYFKIFWMKTRRLVTCEASILIVS